MKEKLDNLLLCLTSARKSSFVVSIDFAREATSGEVARLGELYSSLSDLAYGLSSREVAHYDKLDLPSSCLPPSRPIGADIGISYSTADYYGYNSSHAIQQYVCAFFVQGIFVCSLHFSLFSFSKIRLVNTPVWKISFP